MSVKFAAWLHVTPAPTTLAESSAIYQALRKHGRISTFARSEHTRRLREKDSDASYSTFYTAFPQEPPTLQKTFSVPVYHGLPSARDEDPFNIRGLHCRKPMPAPKTFACTIEMMSPGTARFEEQAMNEESPYHANFKVWKQDWLQDALFETYAPPGISKGCANRVVQDQCNVEPVNGSEDVAPPEKRTKRRKINMRSLLEMWHDAKEEQRRKVGAQKG